MDFVFGRHERLKELEHRVECIALSRLPVLIEGESGTGKEALAKLLHDLSGVGAPFTRIVCGKSIPLSYPPIATPNTSANLNFISPKATGTVFVKNIDLLSPAGQELLLSALEQAEIQNGPGESAEGFRLVSSATESLVTRQLNPDLFHRLSVYRIYLPPLRERREDIPELFSQMVRGAVNGNGAPPPATPRLLDVLMSYSWPGNLRELHNIVRTYVFVARPDEIIAELSNRPRLPSIPSQAPGDRRSLKDQVKGASQKLESEIILRSLESHRWNRRQAAQSLQISYRSLLYKMKNCNLRIQPEVAREREIND